MNFKVSWVEVFSNDNLGATRFELLRILFDNLHASIYIIRIENA